MEPKLNSQCIFHVYALHITHGSHKNGGRLFQTGVIDDCELPCVCWELNLEPLEEQSEVSTIEPSLQSHLMIIHIGT